MINIGLFIVYTAVNLGWAQGYGYNYDHLNPFFALLGKQTFFDKERTCRRVIRAASVLS